MGRIVYVNGNYRDEADATISIFDRGFLMADGVYEVTSVLNGKLIDFNAHMLRLGRSLSELQIAMPWCNDALLAIHRKLIADNNITDGLVYLQVTRGSDGDRDFIFPDPESTKPTLVLFTQDKTGIRDSAASKNGIKIISIKDQRWARRDIKTIQLLYPSWGKMMAKAANADDAWMIQDGFVTEGTSNNAYFIKDGVIVTRALSNDILHGITRAAILRYAAEAQMKIQERDFTLKEAQAADEAFITSATTFVQAVIAIDGKAIGDGKVGPMAKRLREIYLEESLKAAV